MSLRNRAQVGSSVATTKLNTLEDARGRICSGLQGMKEIWDRDKGASLPDKKSKATEMSKGSLWFKQKELNDDWLLKIKLGNSNLYMTQEAEDASNPYFTVAEKEMSQIMTDTIKEVRNGDWDKEIKRAMDRMKS